MVHRNLQSKALLDMAVKIFLDKQAVGFLFSFIVYEIRVSLNNIITDDTDLYVHLQTRRRPVL